MFHQTDCWRFFKTFSVPVVCLLEMSQIPTLAKKSWEGVYSIFLKGDRKLGQISSFFNWTIFMWVVWGRVCVCVCEEGWMNYFWWSYDSLLTKEGRICDLPWATLPLLQGGYMILGEIGVFLM